MQLTHTQQKNTGNNSETATPLTIKQGIIVIQQQPFGVQCAAIVIAANRRGKKRANTHTNYKSHRRPSNTAARSLRCPSCGKNTAIDNRKNISVLEKRKSVETVYSLHSHTRIGDGAALCVCVCVAV